LRVALDYTPAISQTAGVGRYTRSLFSALRRETEERVDWTLWYPKEWRDAHGLPTGETVSTVRLPLSARWSNLLWHRLGVPISIERFVGGVSLVHGTDFVVPPSNAPSVVTVHDLSYALLPHLAYPGLRRYLERAVPRSINRARKVIAVSETTKRDLCEFYEISPNRVEVVHHAADPLFDRPAESQILAAQAQFGLRRPYFVIVGTIEPRKDHKSLLRAFARVHERHPEASLVIIGREGWLADDIMKEIRLAAETRPVFHLQGIRDDVLPGLYGGSTALVFPSQYEGFGLPLLEAMACGTAVIASDTAAHREVAADAALYAPVGNDEAFADQMKQVLEQSATRSEFVDRGSERSSNFSWNEAARRHLEIYREVSGGR
jgi:glycosyltransferase involved in cell wall biosynthesis